jgi:hypothetical protein
LGLLFIIHFKLSQIQWLVTMLNSAGFIEPLWSTNKTTPDCLVPVKRSLQCNKQATSQWRRPADEETTSTKVGIYHYAMVQTTKCRDNTMREKASVVKINNTICKIMYFINAIIGDTNHELGFFRCYGNAEKCKTVCATWHC